MLLTPCLPAKNYNSQSSLALIFLLLCSGATGLLHLLLGYADRLPKHVVTVLAGKGDFRSSV